MSEKLTEIMKLVDGLRERARLCEERADYIAAGMTRLRQNGLSENDDLFEYPNGEILSLEEVLQRIRKEYDSHNL